MSWRGSLEGDVLRERSRDGLERRVSLRKFGPVNFPAYALAAAA